MTESEWLASENPARMIEHLRGVNSAVGVDASPYPVPHTSDRKLRLFACACARSTDLFAKDDGSARLAVETAERYADGARAKTLMAEFGGKTGRSTSLFKYALLGSHCCEPRAIRAAQLMVACPDGPPATAKANLLREVVGNPLRPLLQLCGRHSVVDDCPCCRRLRTPAVTEMARHAYDARDFAGLPILADALEEAGCDNEQVLRHLRGEELVPSPHMPKLGLWGPRRGPHVLGCWVLDLLLGKL